MSAVLAIDVGGTGMKAALIDADGRELRAFERPTPRAAGAAAVVDAILAAAADLADAAGDIEVAAGGVVVPGVVDAEAGVARYSANIGWRDIPLRELLEAKLGLPVALDHDVGAAGLAEGLLGLGRNENDWMLLVIGTGIAAVVVAGGARVRGTSVMAGEIGHVPVYPNGATCVCGQVGCLEAYASAAAIARRYAEAAGRALTAREISASLDTDPIAAQVWHEATEALGLALATCTLLLDPAVIVIAGGLAAAGSVLVEPVRAALRSRLAWRPAARVELSPLGTRAGRLGAAVLAWRLTGRDDFSTWQVRRG